MKNINLIMKCADLFLQGGWTFTKLQDEFHVLKEDIITEVRNRGYIIRKGYKYPTIIGLKAAEEEYIQEYNNCPSISKICKKYHIDTKTLSDRVKELGYEVVNHQNEIKFNNHIFDEIDTEEKAYWLGFIYADGCIDSSPLYTDKKSVYKFELSLKSDDVEHLLKFQKFIEHKNNIVTISDVKCNNSICKRCRICFCDKHFWNTLNSYGCTPKKSLTLQFPDISIFKSNNLIQHFIRGYFDGDGIFTYNDKLHNCVEIGFIGTEDVLTSIKQFLPIKFDYILHLSNPNSNNNITKQFEINGKNAFEVIYYLYNNCSIYLDRKYKRYLESCRSYKELYELLSGKIGESPAKDNPEINSEIKESESLYSVEGEPIYNKIGVESINTSNWIKKNIILPRVSDTPTEISG